MSSPLERLTAALADRYQIQRPLGTGGMATVYLARDLRHDRDVAIKVLKPELAEVVGTERFLSEIKTTANLRHPHILPLYDSGEANGVLFYVMPVAEGETLRARLDREKQLPIADALRIAGEVADALSYAHARGVIHRDIKPDNILLEGGHAFVADFGIARAVSSADSNRLTQTGMSVGTPAYMSPEQASGELEIDGRSDLYSLACVLYEMLGGQPPFMGPNAAALVRQHLMVDAPPITNLRPAVPAHIAGALARALAKSPVDRFNPVAEFSTALVATPEPTPERTAIPAAPAAATATSARPAWLMPVVALVLVVAAFFGWRATRGAGGASAPSGVAVLPFSDLSPDKSQAYLGDGIAETLISALARQNGMKVAPRSVSFGYRDKASDLAGLGAALNVGSVLEGSVQRNGDRLRITAELVSTKDGAMLWSKTFDRKADDIFAVQDEVVREVLAIVQGQLQAAKVSLSRTSGTKDREAYELFLQGQYFWNRRSLDDFKQAIELFQKAIARDSTYAEPWVGIANAYITQTFVDTVWAVPLYEKAKEAAHRAAQIDPNSAGAAVAQAYLTMIADHDFDKSDSLFRDVTKRFPNHAMGHKWYGDVKMVFQDHAGSMREMMEAYRIDPGLGVTMYNIAATYWNMERPDSAKYWLPKAFVASPNLSVGYTFAVRFYAELGDSAMTMASIEGLRRSSPRVRAPKAELEKGWGRDGARGVLRELADEKYGPGLADERTRWLAGAGDKDRAFKYLNEQIDRRDVWSAFLWQSRDLFVLRSDPRWKAAMQRAKVPEKYQARYLELRPNVMVIRGKH